MTRPPDQPRPPQRPPAQNPSPQRTAKQPPAQRPQTPRPQTLAYAGSKALTPALTLDGSAKSIPPEPQAPPRPMTSAARWRSWQEPRVRFWWLSTVVLAAIFSWFTVIEATAYSREQKLITSGVPIQAKIDSIDGSQRTSYIVTPDTPVVLAFDFHGQSYSFENITLNMPSGQFIHPGQIIPIHVNPNDPSEWTDLVKAQSLAWRLVAASVIIPIFAATLATTVILRHKIIRTWREGVTMAYSVEGVQRSALAPLSHTVRCMPLEGRQARIVTVYLPGRLPKPAVGDILWLICAPNHHVGTVAAIAFE